MTKVLIVEDDPSLRELYREEFEEEGYRVETASCAAGAIDLFENDPADCVVLDIRLYGGDGIDLLRRLLDFRPEAAVVLNSAYAHFKHDFATWAAAAYVVKSSDMTELKQAVSSALLQKAA